MAGRSLRGMPDISRWIWCSGNQRFDALFGTRSDVAAAAAAEDSRIVIDGREVGSAVPADRFEAYAFPQFPNRFHHGFHG